MLSSVLETLGCTGWQIIFFAAQFFFLNRTAIFEEALKKQHATKFILFTNASIKQYFSYYKGAKKNDERGEAKFFVFFTSESVHLFKKYVVILIFSALKYVSFFDIYIWGACTINFSTCVALTF